MQGGEINWDKAADIVVGDFARDDLVAFPIETPN